jgi:hypothetical protein
MNERTVDSDGYYERALARTLVQRWDIEDPKTVTFREYTSDGERFEAWLVESLLTGIKAFKKGDSKLAMRCYVQACHYQGRIGGCWPGPMASDAAGELRNGLESKLS